MTTQEVKVGQKFNNYTVIGPGIRNKNSQIYYLCQCICGQKKQVIRGNLGKVMGCGCVRKPYKPRAKTTIQSTIKKKQKTVSARKRIDDLFFERNIKKQMDQMEISHRLNYE